MDYPPSQELNAYNLASPQSEQNLNPVTIASAANIIPTTKLTFITGTAQIATIGTINDDSSVTPVMPGYHELVLVFTNGSPGALLTSGNIQRAGAPAQNIPVTLFYDPNTKKYWVGPVS